MLIPSKFSGYQEDGRRIYPIGGGVGEAMLLGAAVGGGSAAITGGDPLKGALLGGLTGGIGGGISGALPSAAADTALQTGAQAATQAGAQAGAQAATQLGTNLATQTGTDLGLKLGAGATGFNPATAQGAMTGAGYTLGSPSASSLYSLGSPTIAPGIGAGAGGISNLPAAISAPGGGTFTEGMARFAQNPLASIKANPFTAGAAGLAGAMGGRRKMESPNDEYEGPLSRFRFNPESYVPAFADGGIASLAASEGYDRMVGEQPMYQAMASGGLSDLGTYSDGGRMLRGPGDGMSDSIPGVIGGKRPARLADGEFVVPADVVSHLGNGSTDAGAKQLYSMMDKVRKARTGTQRQGREINPRKYMPA